MEPLGGKSSPQSSSEAALALWDATLAFLALYAAVLIRFEKPISRIEQELGPLWPRGLLFAAILVMSHLAFGLYSDRQRTQLTEIVLRMAAALVVASGLLAALFYILPSLTLYRGAWALAIVLAGCCVLASRLVFRLLRRG